MAKFELDSTMLKKLDKLHSACTTLNSLEKSISASYQINHKRVLISIQKNDWDFPLWSFQRMFIQLTYPDLDQALKEIIFYQSYEFP